MKQVLSTQAGRQLTAELMVLQPRTLDQARRDFLARMPGEGGERIALFDSVEHLRDVAGRLPKEGAVARPLRFLPIVKVSDAPDAALKQALAQPIGRVHVIHALPRTLPELRAMYSNVPRVSRQQLDSLNSAIARAKAPNVSVEPVTVSKPSSADLAIKKLEQAYKPGTLRVLVAHSSKRGVLRFGDGTEVTLHSIEALQKLDSPIFVLACNTAAGLPAQGTAVQIATDTSLSASRAIGMIAAVGRIKPTDVGGAVAVMSRTQPGELDVVGMFAAPTLVVFAAIGDDA